MSGHRRLQPRPGHLHQVRHNIHVLLTIAPPVFPRDPVATICKLPPPRSPSSLPVFPLATLPPLPHSEHVNSWKMVTDAVHKKGGYIFCQLWHIGRVAHASFKDHPLVRGRPVLPPVSASDVPAKGSTETYPTGANGKYSIPRPYLEAEIEALIEQYRHAVSEVICARANWDTLSSFLA